MSATPELTRPLDIGGVTLPNRVVLAPLAGIGNWFVRLQAKRYGAGLAVSEMVSSFAIHHRNEKTMRELLRIHPDERGGGPVSIQLFGQDPDVMRSAAATVAERGADLIDLNMGCPVPKVCKTGAGAALIKDPDTAVAVARAAREGSGLPVTDYDLAAKLVASLGAPVILTGGLHTPAEIRAAHEHTGAAAVMLARGALGYPWLFEQVLGLRDDAPGRDEILDELDWVMDRAVEHLGPDRAGRYLRKFYPWYADRLEASKEVQAALQQSASVEEARAVLAALAPVAEAA